MTLRFLGKDPGSEDQDSPTVWIDETTGDYILQGWAITDQKTLAEIGEVPPSELVMRFPQRMTSFFPKAGGGDGD
jgi:hypothetical protein